MITKRDIADDTVCLREILEQCPEFKNELYSSDVDKTIKKVYPIADEMAIIINYMDDPNEKHTEEYNRLTAYRESVKCAMKIKYNIK